MLSDDDFRSSLRRVVREKKTLSETATPYALRARELQNIYESLGREPELGDEWRGAAGKVGAVDFSERILRTVGVP